MANETTERLRKMQRNAAPTEPPVRRTQKQRGARPRSKAEEAPEVVYEDEDNDMEASFEPAQRRRAARKPARDAARETIHNTRRGAMVVTGRNGEVLTRRRTQAGDPYDVPGNEIPEGWSYQWNPVTVLGQDVVRTQNQMYANGWRPVPATRHPGRWTKPGATGEIIVEGLRLEERPESLTQEAVKEGEILAKQLIRDQAESLQLTKKLPRGFEANKRLRGTGASVSMQIDRSFELPPGEYQPADDNVD